MCVGLHAVVLLKCQTFGCAREQSHRLLMRESALKNICKRSHHTLLAPSRTLTNTPAPLLLQAPLLSFINVAGNNITGKARAVCHFTPIAALSA